jgi:hypothetical protein
MGVPPEPKPASPPDWDNTAWVTIQDGMTYIEADAVGRWLERASRGNLTTRELPKLWEENVNQLVRHAIEKETKKWWRW